MTDETERFLSRWSRLKRTGNQDVRGPAAPVLPEQRVGLEPSSESEPPTEADDGAAAPPDLPTIESLDKDSDFAQFMQQGVPEELKRLALRKLWRISPGVIDGLDDYDEDYSLVEMVLDKASDVAKAAKDLPGGQAEKALGAGDAAALEQPPPPADETESARASEETEALDADPAEGEFPPRPTDEA